MIKIMFVCTGNICRSAMADGYMQSLVNKKTNKEEMIISSCGIYAISGQKATDNAIAVMKDYGIDLTKHRAKSINDIDIQNYDIILCMTELQKECVKKLYNKISDNVYTLKEYANNKSSYIDIDDPWGLSKDVYEDCAKEIIQNIDKIFNNIK